MEICYQVSDTTGSIFWAAAEEFGELAGQKFSLGEMEAKEIDKLEGLSSVAKLLLSAVAGALIQHLMDGGMDPQVIFSQGSFWVAEQ